MKNLSLEQKIALDAKMDLAIYTGCRKALDYVEGYVREYHKGGYDVTAQIEKLQGYGIIIKNSELICGYK